MRGVMQDFINTLRNITVNSVATISFVFRIVNSTIGQDSIIYNKCNDFRSIFQKYQLKELTELR
jgi:hypothetical protein